MTDIVTPGLGTVFKWFITSALTAVTQVKDFQRPTTEHPAVKFKHLGSTAMGMVAGGVLNEGEITLTILWDPANTGHAAMLTDHRAGTIRTCSLTYTDPGDAVEDWAQGKITKWAPGSVDDEGICEDAITIAVVGSTLTP